MKVYNNSMSGIFIFNPESGSGKIEKYKNYIVSELSKKFGDITLAPTSYSGHATKIANDACGKYEYLFVSGGDGTLNEVINGIADKDDKPIIGYIPTGTVNDVAHSLGISKKIKRAVKGILNGTVYNHDIFKVNDRFGIYVCCAGLFTVASFDTKRSAKKKFGKVAYFFRGIKDLFKAKPIHLKMQINDQTVEQDVALMLVLNSRSTAGFMVNRPASLNDGEVEVLLVHSHKNKIKLSDVLRCVGIFLFGVKVYKKNKHVSYFKTAAFNLETDSGLTINLDGEKCGEGSFDFSVIKSGVQIIVPQKSYEKIAKLKG